MWGPCEKFVMRLLILFLKILEKAFALAWNNLKFPFLSPGKSRKMKGM